MKQQEKILKEIKRLASKLFANQPIAAYLYGSRVRGEAHENSDWDILILADDSKVDTDSYEKYAYPFTEIGWRLGEQITPLLYSISQWNAERNTAFYLNVQKDAIKL